MLLFSFHLPRSSLKPRNIRFAFTTHQSIRAAFWGLFRLRKPNSRSVKLPDGSWVFLLSGRDPHSDQPLLVIADVYAIRSRLAGEKARTPDAQSFSALLAPDMVAIFETTTPCPACAVSP